jgi:hypothetical protein
MISPELFNVLKQVISSWQVIAMAVVVIIFWSIVNAAVKQPEKSKTRRNAKTFKKLNRPPAQPELDKKIDDSALGIEE